MTDRRDITVDQFLAHPPAKVWQALTEPRKLAAWFMPNDFAPVVGHRFTLHRTPNREVRFSATIRCEVLEVDHERLLSYSWTDGGDYAGDLDSVVTWTLRPEGHGTRLFLEHRGFRSDDPVHQAAHRLMSDGWRLLLTHRLPAALSAALSDPTTTTDPPTASPTAHQPPSINHPSAPIRGARR
jgi:uncharacterized protein YndB with AHSA1/START domain